MVLILNTFKSPQLVLQEMLYDGARSYGDTQDLR